MITLNKLRALTLEPSARIGGKPFVSAASGLVCIGDHIYVVADDELHLAVFDQSDKPGHLVRLFDGALPDDHVERKRRKPDLETLTRFPAMPGYPHGALLALGSGSTPARCRATVIALDATGALTGPASVVDLATLYSTLSSTFPALNIEGATVVGDELRLFQRGNVGTPESLVVRLPLPTFLAALGTGRIDAIEPLAIRRLDLGSVDGVPYSVTDVAMLRDGRTVVTAVAENTVDSYADGACLGALVGLLDSELHVVTNWPLDRRPKIEGVDATLDGSRIDLRLVTDADDPDVPAALYSASISL